MLTEPPEYVLYNRTVPLSTKIQIGATVPLRNNIDDFSICKTSISMKTSLIIWRFSANTC
jgi:hypothetical protein